MSGDLELQHEDIPHPNRKPGPSAYDLVKVGFFLFGFPANGFGSIDVSKECNLRCKHCYFFEQERPTSGELSVDTGTRSSKRSRPNPRPGNSRSSSAPGWAASR